MAISVNMIRRNLALLTAFGLGLALVACAAPSQPPVPPVVSAVPEPQPAPPSPPPRKPARPSQTLANLPPAAAEPRAGIEQGPSPGPAPESANFDRLIGLDQPQVSDLLGDPRTKAESPPATIWRYAGHDCELDVYFYLDLQSQAMRALHYEVRSHDSPERSAQRCYGDVVGRQHSHSESAGGTDRPH
jgi:hypothetical protein